MSEKNKPLVSGTALSSKYNNKGSGTWGQKEYDGDTTPLHRIGDAITTPKRKTICGDGETNADKIAAVGEQHGIKIKENSFFDRRHKRINIDLSHRCPLECLRCGRQRSYINKGLKVPGRDLSISEYNKLLDWFPRISFCGQYSDPIHHPKINELLKIAYERKVMVEVHVASSLKPMQHYINAFEANPQANWIFGIDGMPEESKQYRINQDGEKLFKIMLESKKYLRSKPLWQFIIFSYNENSIDKAMKMAKDNDVDFIIINSARWTDDDDWLKPKTKRTLLENNASFKHQSIEECIREGCNNK
jgi:MoaA/NifB/PqqE/SkfB family radical SAM enzyme